MSTNQDKLAIENMELKAQLHEIKTALGITQDHGSESTPLTRIAAYTQMRIRVSKALDIYGDYYVSNHADSMVKAIAKLKSDNRTIDQVLAGFAKQLGFEYFDNEQVAIKIDELQEKSAIAKQFQSDLINTDIGELRSERDRYRSILDKLCDRGNFASIEALEQFTDAGHIVEIGSQTELRQKLTQSQAMSLKYMNRIVALENELRSLQEPLPEMMQQFLKGDSSIGIGDVLNRRRGDRAKGAEINDRDRLTETELIQIVRSLLPRLN